VTYDTKLYTTIREHGNWENWSMLQIETLECTKQEAHTKEREWYEKLNAELNMKLPIQSNDEREEYYKEYNKTNYEYRNDYKYRRYCKIKDQMIKR
jgi:hypothetical protein